MLLRSGLNHHCRHSEYANKDNKFDTSGYVGPENQYHTAHAQDQNCHS